MTVTATIASAANTQFHPEEAVSQAITPTEATRHSSSTKRTVSAAPRIFPFITAPAVEYGLS